MDSAVPRLFQCWPLPKDEHSSVSQPLFPRVWLSIQYSWAPPCCCCSCPQTISPCLAMLRPSWLRASAADGASPSSIPCEWGLLSALSTRRTLSKSSPWGILHFYISTFFFIPASRSILWLIISSEVWHAGRCNLIGLRFPQSSHTLWAPLTQPSFITPSADLLVSIAAAKPICFASASSVISFPNLNISRLPPSDLQEGFPVLQSRLLVRLLLTTPLQLAVSTLNWNTVSQHGVFYMWYKWVMVCLILWNRKKVLQEI